MSNTVFVLVYRTEHNDYMHISEEVQKKYPHKFVLQVEPEVEKEEVKAEVVEEEEVKKPVTKRKPRVKK